MNINYAMKHFWVGSRCESAYFWVGSRYESAPSFMIPIECNRHKSRGTTKDVLCGHFLHTCTFEVKLFCFVVGIIISDLMHDVEAIHGPS